MCDPDTKYFVYCHINRENGKRYFGITCQRPESRWRNGDGYANNAYFHRAIEKYGWDGFDHLILFRGLTKTEAERMEILLIDKFSTASPDYGYNIEKGGNGTEKFTDEIKEKISKALKGHSCSQETRQKIRASKVGVPSERKGIKQTEEQRIKNSLSHKGQTPWNKGKPWSAEEKAKCNGKRVLCIETSTIYRTAHEASKELSIDFSSICKCCRGTAKRAGGYHWQYMEET